MGLSPILTGGEGNEVATINGERITKKGFDSYKLFVNSGENKLSDSQILNMILERKMIYDNAVQAGVVATNEEIDNAIKAAQNVTKENNDFNSYYNNADDLYDNKMVRMRSPVRIWVRAPQKKETSEIIMWNRRVLILRQSFMTRRRMWSRT